MVLVFEQIKADATALAELVVPIQPARQQGPEVVAFTEIFDESMAAPTGIVTFASTPEGVIRLRSQHYEQLEPLVC